MVRGAFGGVLLALALLAAGCDSFPAACETSADCDDAALCEQGECITVSPALLARCRGAEIVDEVCNGRDDDCDDEIDEGCEVGDACILGEGICARPGRLADSPSGPVCSAVPGQPVTETCNGLDDDCDGAVDETCRPGDACAVGIGYCRRDGRVAVLGGSNACVGGPEGGPLEPGEPRDEVCNDRVDDDCDGVVDEGFDEIGEACVAGVGICARDGFLVCVDGAVRCSEDPGRAEAEVCDNLDNDCDGTTDEGFGVGMVCVVGVGACASSAMTICNQTRDGSICNAVAGDPTPETCNNIDDDCDGGVDEDAAGAALTEACGTDVGECVSGMRTCTGGFWGECVGAVMPAMSDACDSLDNDCDGAIDEVSRTCGSDRGICRLGTQECIDGAWAPCEGSIEPEVETCDGRDEDCDGVVDEDDGGGEPDTLTRVCGEFDVGECRRGVQLCSGGRFGACLGAQSPVAERCDELDNDCDGETDEDYERLGDGCVSGTGPCLTEGVYVCEEGGARTRCGAEPNLDAATPEACNNLDDDCDGETDEDFHLGAPCIADDGRSGTCTCGFAREAACSISVDGGGVLRPPAEDDGNARDDDCDGAVDER